MRITKQQVLDALTTEPLGAFGVYIDNENSPDCQVCAVGAVMRAANRRRKLDDDYDVFPVCDAATGNSRYVCALVDDELGTPPTYKKAVAALLEIKKRDKLNHLAALSSLYEWHDGRGTPIGTIRRRLKKFVQEHFPKTLRLQGI